MTYTSDDSSDSDDEVTLAANTMPSSPQPDSPTSTASTSETYIPEEGQDLTIHYRPDVGNLDCLGKLDPTSVDQLHSVQKKDNTCGPFYQQIYGLTLQGPHEFIH